MLSDIDEDEAKIANFIDIQAVIEEGNSFRLYQKYAPYACNAFLELRSSQLNHSAISDESD